MKIYLIVSVAVILLSIIIKKFSQILWFFYTIYDDNIRSPHWLYWSNQLVQFSTQFILSPIENYKSPAEFIIGPFVFCQGDGLVSSSAILDNYAFALSFLPLLPFPQVYSSIIVRNFSLAPFAWEKTPWHCFGHATCQHGWPWAFLRTPKKHLGTAVKFQRKWHWKESCGSWDCFWSVLLLLQWR